MGYSWIFCNSFVSTLGICMVFIFARTEEHNQSVEFGDYVNVTIRDTMETGSLNFCNLLGK